MAKGATPIISVMNDEARALVSRLQLEPLPHEGGFFRRTWTSSTRTADGRHAGSAITFLLTDEDFSALHQLLTDELWFFHSGDSIEHVQFSVEQPDPLVTYLGAALSGDSSQLTVRGGGWQGARIRPRDDDSKNSRRGWSLMSCVMVPAWDEREFTLGARAQLLTRFPQATDWIHALTR